MLIESDALKTVKALRLMKGDTEVTSSGYIVVYIGYLQTSSIQQVPDDVTVRLAVRQTDAQLVICLGRGCSQPLPVTTHCDRTAWGSGGRAVAKLREKFSRM